MNNTKVWYITGASKGMGLSLVKQLLAKGHSVAATSRSMAAFEEFREFGGRFLPLEVDLKNEQSIAVSIKKTVENFGRLDIID